MHRNSQIPTTCTFCKPNLPIWLQVQRTDHLSSPVLLPIQTRPLFELPHPLDGARFHVLGNHEATWLKAQRIHLFRKHQSPVLKNRTNPRSVSAVIGSAVLTHVFHKDRTIRCAHIYRNRHNMPSENRWVCAYRIVGRSCAFPLRNRWVCADVVVLRALRLAALKVDAFAPRK